MAEYLVKKFQVSVLIKVIPFLLFVMCWPLFDIVDKWLFRVLFFIIMSMLLWSMLYDIFFMQDTQNKIAALEAAEKRKSDTQRTNKQVGDQ